ncbi:MAG: HAMP domain-containing histidine kinase [Acidobacteria bacterium]|nr:HAMP domain-containing histidine kinase [Acidobacteriota bacterium]
MSRGWTLSLLFTFTIVLPAAILTLVALRGLQQERARAAQQFHDELRLSAIRSAANLDLEIEDLLRVLDQPWTQASQTAEVSRVPMVVVEAAPEAVSWAPAAALSYNPGPVHAVAPPADLDAAQHCELRDQAYEKALAAYRASSGAPQWSMFLQARLLRKMNRGHEAEAAWRNLLGLPDTRLGQLPSHFIARYETSPDLALLKELEDGRWPMHRTLFRYYDSELRKAAHAESRPVAAKTRLADTVATFVESPRATLPDGSFAWWRNSPSGVRAVILSQQAVLASIWPRVALPRLNFGLTGEADAIRPRSFARGWGIRMDTSAPPQLAAFDRQRRWFEAMLALMLGLIAFGAHFLFKAVRHEMETARQQAEFVATVSHEFRSPLTGLRQLVDLLERGRVGSEDRKREYYGMMAGECARLTRLVENLLDFSRLESEKKAYSFELLDPQALLTEIAEGFRHERVSLELNIPASLPLIRADRVTLATAVQNLLDNAVKYSPESSVVWLEASCANGAVAITVRDRGVGIAPSEQSRIFDRFYRVPGAMSKKVKGAGIGLALVQRITRAHGGRVSLESQPGEGSAFTLHFEVAS